MSFLLRSRKIKRLARGKEPHAGRGRTSMKLRFRATIIGIFSDRLEGKLQSATGTQRMKFVRKSTTGLGIWMKSDSSSGLQFLRVLWITLVFCQSSAIEQTRGAAMTIRVLLALLVLVFSPQAEAKEGWEAFAMGNKTCVEWTQIQAGGTMLTEMGSDITAQTQWITGFLTAYNYFQSATPNVAEGTDINGVFARIDTYCATHPLDPIARAAIAVIDELSRRGRLQ